MQQRALVLLLFVLLAGCRRETNSWRIAWSPDGRSCVAVAGHIYFPFLQEHLGLDIVTPSFRETIVRDVIDAGICFAELAWSADSRVVAGFLHPCDRRSWIWFAYDTRTRRRVDPEVMKDRLREAVRENYAEHLRDRPGLDPLVWATTDGAETAFVRKRVGPGVDLHAITTEPHEHRPIVTGRPAGRR